MVSRATNKIKSRGTSTKVDITYSLRPKLSNKSCFMKQKCHFQKGVTQYKNAVSNSGINITFQHCQMRYITLF